MLEIMVAGWHLGWPIEIRNGGKMSHFYFLCFLQKPSSGAQRIKLNEFKVARGNRRDKAISAGSFLIHVSLSDVLEARIWTYNSLHLSIFSLYGRLSFICLVHQSSFPQPHPSVRLLSFPAFIILGIMSRIISAFCWVSLSSVSPSTPVNLVFYSYV